MQRANRPPHLASPVPASSCAAGAPQAEVIEVEGAELVRCATCKREAGHEAALGLAKSFPATQRMRLAFVRDAQGRLVRPE